jgi:outer membrane receptor protein involved in Fe transport
LPGESLGVSQFPEVVFPSLAPAGFASLGRAGSSMSALDSHTIQGVLTKILRTHTMFFVQDDIRVSRRLTINAGLRFDYNAGWTERYDRNVRGYPFNSLDLSLFWKTQIRERANFHLRLEAFNALNRVDFDNPNTTLGNVNFGGVTALKQEANPARQLQISARITF